MEWIAKFKGRFDQGWDKVREETFARQKAAGVIPANAKLTGRDASIPAWDSLNADQKKVFAHMMEVYAAALAHCDNQMARILDTIEAESELDNTLVIYIQGDNGAIYHDGWVAATTPAVAPWDSAAEMQGRVPAVLDYKWELYHVSEDYSEANNLAAKEPAKLKELQELFWTEAEKYNVLPVENSRIDRFDVSLRPSLTRGRDAFTYYPGLVRIPEGAAPDTKNKSWQIKTEVVIPKSGAEGVLLTHGGRFSGWGLYLLKGKPTFCYNLAGVARYTVASKDKLAPGAHTIVYDFKYDGGGIGKGGTGTIQVDGKTVATGRIERTLAFRLSLDETLDCGEDTGTPVTEDYRTPFKFTGEIKKATINLKPTPLTVQDQRKFEGGTVAAAIAAQ